MLANMKQCITVVTLFFMLTSANAAVKDEDRYYDIELIIFESTDKASYHAEAQRNTLSRELPEEAIELGKAVPRKLIKGYDPKLSFRLLPASTYQLSQEVKLLQQSGHYNVLLHTAWRQPGMDRETAIPVHIRKEYVSQVEQPVQENNTFSAFGPASSAFTPPPAKNVLDGYIRIILSRYLHAQVDLAYTVPTRQNVQTIPAATTESNAEYRTEKTEIVPLMFHLNQSRKMRSTEVHYLDHPVLGVIVLATPYGDDT